MVPEMPSNPAVRFVLTWAYVAVGSVIVTYVRTVTAIKGGRK